MHTYAANSSRATPAEWLLTLFLGANLAWTTFGLGGYPPETRVVTWVLTGALLVTYFFVCAWERRPLLASDPAGWALVPFLVYAVVNVTCVSPVPWLGWLDWLGWANMVATFWVVLNGTRSRSTRRTLWLVLTVLGLSAVAMGCYQRFVQPDWLMLGRQQATQFIGRASGPFGIPNSLAGFLILLLPATGAMAWQGSAARRVWWGWVTVVFVVGLFLTVSRGAWLSLALALVAWPLLWSNRSWPRRLAVAGAAFAGLMLATSSVYWLSLQARVRLDRLVADSGELSRPILWRGAWELWRSEPTVGTGAGSYNVLFERHRPAGFVDEPQWAHNEYLNTLSDFGLVGLTLFVGAAGWVAWQRLGRRRSDHVSKRDSTIDSPLVVAAFGVGCVAFAVQMAFDFHLRIPALGMAIAVVAALMIGRTPAAAARMEGAVRNHTRWWWGVLALVIAAGLFPAVRWQQAEALRHGARGNLDRESRAPTEPRPAVLQQAEADLRRAVALWPRHAGAWSDLAHALQFQAYVEPSRTRDLAGLAETAARRALEISSVVPEFWLRLGIALDMQTRRADALPAFNEALRLAPRSATGWYYYADHLSRDTKTREDALRAIAACLSLDPGNAPAEALRAKLSPLP